MTTPGMGAPPDLDAVIGQLLGDAHRVRRLWPPGIRLVLWLLLDAVVLGLVLAFAPRPDLLQHISRPIFVFQLAALLGAAAVLAALAFRGAVPGRAAGRAERTAAVLLVAIALGLLSQEPAHRVSFTGFIATGTGCFISTLLLGTLPWATLFIAVRRGAPLAARCVGADAGAAALLFAVAATRLSCPAEDSLHLLVWHGVPVAFGVALSAVAGAAWLGAWRAKPARSRSML